MTIQDLKNKKIAILGLGTENVALVKYLIKYKANLTICDRSSREELEEFLKEIKNYKIDFRLGPTYLDALKDFDIVFRTPGLPYLNQKIQEAKEKGVIVSSEIKYFFANCPCPIVGITGTKGKGTTSTLTYEILKNENKNKKRKVYLAGNIGKAPIDFLDQLKKEDVVVLELSSFQLQDLDRSPHIAVVLDIKEDHLDIHKDREEYVTAKQNIVNFQTKNDFAVINADYLTSFEFALKSSGETFWFSRHKSIDQGAWVKEGKKIYFRNNDKDYFIANTSDVLLRGEHNLENICGALTASFLAGASIKSIVEEVRNFRGLEHRLEFVKEINGVRFYNDSFSTTPETAIAAIKSFKEPIILIAGGSEKGADYSELGKVISESSVKVAILIGVTGPRIKSKIQKTKSESNLKVQMPKIIDDCKNISEVMEALKEEVVPGDVVLLSPASASFDWFKNYKDRGTQFKALVKSCGDV